MDISRPLTDRHEICTQVGVVWSSLKTHFGKFLSPPQKSVGKKLKFRRQSDDTIDWFLGSMRGSVWTHEPV